MIVTVTPNPCVDKTFTVPTLAPGRKHVAAECSAIAGGKGVNVSRAVKRLGGETRAVVLVAGTTGQEVVNMIGGDGVACVPVWTDGLTRTITTVLETDRHRQTPLFEPGPGLTEAARDALCAAVGELAPQCAIMTLNGTIPDPDAAGLYEELLGLAKAGGARTALDSHGPEFSAGLKAGPDLVKPNVEELSRWAGAPLDSEEKQWEAMARLRDMGVAQVLLSRGADGALFLAEGVRYRVTPPAIQEVNPVGSGDAFVAGYCTAWEQGKEPADCLRLATACGAANAAVWEIGHFRPEDLPSYQSQVRLEAL